MTSFDQATYWRDRVSGKMGLGAVGHRSLGAAYNRWIYQRRVDVLNSLRNEAIRVDRGVRVLDLGCGSGFYESYWQSRGVMHLTGVDISAQNVATLREAYPDYRFVESDLTESTTSIEGQQDVVTLFDVLYHIVDDAAACRVLGFCFVHLAKNGRLLIHEQLVKRDYSLREHVKFRGRDHFVDMLHSQGLEIEQEIPLFVLLVPPVYGNRPLDLLIAGVYYAAGLVFRAIPSAGSLAGRMAYAIDARLMKRGILTPNNSLYIVRRTR